MTVIGRPLRSILAADPDGFLDRRRPALRIVAASKPVFVAGALIGHASTWHAVATLLGFGGEIAELQHYGAEHPGAFRMRDLSDGWRR